MTIATILLILAVLCVAVSNGANDNFKGVAALFGSGACDYNSALRWASVTTFLGAVAATYLGARLAAAFGGKGLVPDVVAGRTAFLGAVALAAGATVLLASRLGLPVSTTHALVGGLLGAGFVAAPAELQVSVLASKFLVPLAVGPLAAFGATIFLVPVMQASRRRLGITPATCMCVGEEADLELTVGGTVALSPAAPMSATIGTVSECSARYGTPIAGVVLRSLLRPTHFLSAGAMCFARGLNDAPKIAALGLAAGGFIPPVATVLLIGGAMVAGGLLGARRVAETTSHRITEISEGDGLVANIVTSALVILGSAAALPLSTTHVSCGALFGLGALRGSARRATILRILAAWFATLPLAALVGAAAYQVLE